MKRKTPMAVLKKIGQVVIFSLVAYFIFTVLFKNWLTVRESLSTINVGYLFLSILSMSLAFAWMVYIWYRLVIRYNLLITFWQAWYIYLKASLIRYIPGNIWGLAAKAYMMTRIGLKKSEAVFLMVFESAILVFSGIVTYLLTPAARLGGTVTNAGLACVAVLLLIFLVYPPSYLKLLRLLNKNIEIRTLPPLFLLKLIFFYVIYWGISGVSTYFLGLAVTALPLGKVYIITGIFAVSWAIGFLSLITPSGLGVREVSLIYFLGKVMIAPLATVVAILARIVFITSELVSFGMGYLMNRLSNRRQIAQK